MINKIIIFIIIFFFKILLCISVFMGIIYLLKNTYEWYKYERHANKIEVIAEFGNEHCVNTEYPLALTIINNSSQTIEYSTIYVKVSYIGYSNKLNGVTPFVNDRIIKSGESVGNCWKIESLQNSFDPSYPIFLTDEGKTVKVTSTYFDFKND